VTSLVLVPSLGGPQAALYALAAAATAVGVVFSVVLSAPRTTSRVAAALLCAAVAFLALRELPAAASTRRTQYANQASFTNATSISATESGVGVDPSFLDFLGGHLPPDATFAVVAGSRIKTSAPQSWAQWALFPRIEEYTAQCRAQWLVFFDHPPKGTVPVGRPAEFKPRFSVAKVAKPCA
jgi:hypothetical protein